MIGIIGAMQIEIQELIDSMKHAEAKTISGVTYWQGMIEEQEIVAAVCGIGKVFAALCTQTMILHYHPTCIINIGVAGALSPSLCIGDIVVADKVCQHDIDTTALGDPLGLISGINQVFLSCDSKQAEALYQTAKENNFAVWKGTIASGDCFVAKLEKKALLKQHFEAIACEMEGGAIGQICYVNQLPFCLIRAISDGADSGAGDDYQTFVQKSAVHMQKMIKQYLKTKSEKTA
ncbi:MAG: 5'-methylthioadenosine/adenosylhomocysteine nucleosidase [Clostridiales bacterium]|nr:5'-methylthioadenosine/adenosylhomocysteine nucleosidase [Clostridiales bacterium]